MDIDDVPPSPKRQLKEVTTNAPDNEELCGYEQTAAQEASPEVRAGPPPSRAHARDRLLAGSDNPAECASNRNAVIDVAPLDVAPGRSPQPLHHRLPERSAENRSACSRQLAGYPERAVRPGYPDTRLTNLPHPPTQDKRRKVVTELDIPDDQGVEYSLYKRGRQTCGRGPPSGSRRRSRPKA